MTEHSKRSTGDAAPQSTAQQAMPPIDSNSRPVKCPNVLLVLRQYTSDGSAQSYMDEKKKAFATLGLLNAAEIVSRLHAFIPHQEHHAKHALQRLRPAVDSFLKTYRDACIIGFGAPKAGTTWALGISPTSPGLVKSVFARLKHEKLSSEIKVSFFPIDGYSSPQNWEGHQIEDELDTGCSLHRLLQQISDKRKNEEFHLVITFLLNIPQRKGITRARLTVADLCSGKLPLELFEFMKAGTGHQGSPLSKELSAALSRSQTTAVLASITSSKSNRKENLEVIRLLLQAGNIANNLPVPRDLTGLAVENDVYTASQLGGESSSTSVQDNLSTEPDSLAQLTDPPHQLDGDNLVCNSILDSIPESTLGMLSGLVPESERDLSDQSGSQSSSLDSIEGLAEPLSRQQEMNDRDATECQSSSVNSEDYPALPVAALALHECKETSSDLELYASPSSRTSVHEDLDTDDEYYLSIATKRLSPAVHVVI